MKTKEFKNRVNSLGLEFYTYGDELNIEAGYYDNVVAAIDVKERYGISISYDDYIELDEDTKKELYKLCFEYAQTPVEDRKEEKKFYLKHRWMRNINGFSRALKIDIEDGTADVGLMCPSLGYKNQFTKKEIEEIKEKFNTDLADFKEVEVGE